LTSRTTTHLEFNEGVPPDILEQIAAWNGWLNGYVWGWPTIALLLGTGVLLTVLTGGVQFRRLGFALREVLGKITQKSAGPGTVSPFQAVATALASTVGVGNIAGVATALSIGGPGALFWLWVSGVLGMCTKFAEIVIALHYREPDATGVMRGGAMYTLKRLGGEVTEILVPAMALFYLGGGLVILLRYATEIPTAIGLVFDGAFTGTAATGGFAGSTLMMALRYGVARGLFSNEAGLGSAPMVHAAAQTDHPVRQGLYGIFEVFVDTILVCTTTGLVILVTGAWHGGATGAALAGQAFSTGLPGTWGNIVVTTSLVLFAFSTVIGWSYYGETGIV
jgi:AGCS family alanine or glycine:cation symporter